MRRQKSAEKPFSLSLSLSLSLSTYLPTYLPFSMGHVPSRAGFAAFGEVTEGAIRTAAIVIRRRKGADPT
jgi:hypothetical protein